MTWVKLDDQFPDHPKIWQVGHLGGWIFVCGLCYSAKYLTDGFVPAGIAERLSSVPRPKPHIAKLVEAGLWEQVEGGYQIRGYLEYQPSAEQVKSEREIARRRKAMNDNPELRKAIRARDGDNCRYCGVEVNWRDRKSPVGGTYDHVLPLSKGGDESLGNLVVCCRDCNGKKGPRTPGEAGMALRPSRDQAGINPEPDQETGHPSPFPPLDVDESSSPLTVVAGDGVEERVYEVLANQAIAKVKNVGNLDAYRRRCIATARQAHGEKVRSLLEQFDAPPDVIAAAIAGEVHSLGLYRRRPA